MRSAPLNILQVSKADVSGGAERVAWDLFQQFRIQQQVSRMAVSKKVSGDHDVLEIPSVESLSHWVHFWHGMQERLMDMSPNVRGVGFWRGSRLMAWLANPLKAWEKFWGIEDFRHPGFCHLLKQMPVKPDIIHGHNLHGGYFDLHVLPSLSHDIPVVLTLHDMWLLSGHCAHSFECERWKSGCGHCPDLTIYPEIERDASACNWWRKQKLYEGCRLYVATPSRWLMKKVQQSILMPGIVECRVIPNGVDLEVFNSRDRADAREQLGISASSRVLLFTANKIRNNPWKNYQMLRAVLEQVEMRYKEQDLLFIALGEEAPPENIGRSVMQFVPHQKDARHVALYYQAADVYVHAAKVDTFPLAVLEALACGTPVVATAVGGIPEQVVEGETGFLVPSGDSLMMAARIIEILDNDALRRILGRNAETYARLRFDLKQQVNDYLAWYREIVGQEK